MYLQDEDYLVVGWQLALTHVLKVLHDLLDFSGKASQGLNLLLDIA